MQWPPYDYIDIDPETYGKAIQLYLADESDKKAIRQSMHQPLRPALTVWKWINGRRLGSTLGHELAEEWNKIKELVRIHYGLDDLRDADPCKLGDMNIYAIGLMKEYF